MPRTPRKTSSRLALLLACCAALPSAFGQSLPLESALALPLPVPPLETPQPAADALLRETGGRVRALGHAAASHALARAQPRRVALDPRGAAIVRHEYVAFDIDDAALAAASGAGFDVVRRERFETLGIGVTVLRDRRARSPARGLAALRAALPAASSDFHHLYLAAAVPAAQRRDEDGGAAIAAEGHATPLRVGLIDGGVDTRSVALARIRIERHGCAGVAHPQPHGTAVAERLVRGRAGTLYAADIWCGDAVGRGALGIVEALEWMSKARVPVINISLVGPDNPLLQRAVSVMLARGHIVVAAVGNDGPAAPPLFPAAYDGVIGVAAVDAKLRPLPESASGPHVDFCAPGVVDARRRGTSFAAPIVAAAAADLLAAEPTQANAGIVARLARDARDVGRPGVDRRCGAGVVSPD